MCLSNKSLSYIICLVYSTKKRAKKILKHMDMVQTNRAILTLRSKFDHNCHEIFSSWGIFKYSSLNIHIKSNQPYCCVLDFDEGSIRSNIFQRYIKYSIYFVKI